MLAWRDIRVRYKHTLLGAAWAVAPPLLTMAIFLLVLPHGMGVADLTGGVDMPYPLFALSGLAPWAFFVAGLTSAISSLVSNRALITKIYLPREVFPLAGILSASADFAVAAALVFGLASYYRLTGGWEFAPGAALLYWPLAFATQVVWTVGLGLWLAMANLFYRDVGFVMRAILPLMMFVTNVVYPLRGGHPIMNLVIALNPMVPILSAYRFALMPHGASPLGPLAWSGLAGSGVLILGWLSFQRNAWLFAERV